MIHFLLEKKIGHSVSTASLPAMALNVPDSALFYSVYVLFP